MAGRIGDLFTRAAEMGMPALATTDHGYVFGAYEFWKKAQGTGVKPIIGVEAYVAPGATHRSDRTRVKWGEENQAADLTKLIDHLETAGRRFELAGINGHEDLDTAATFLAHADEAPDDTERAVFLRKADELLCPIVWDMTQEYREMVGD